jgi:hypothetical protein
MTWRVGLETIWGFAHRQISSESVVRVCTGIVVVIVQVILIIHGACSYNFIRAVHSVEAILCGLQRRSRLFWVELLFRLGFLWELWSVIDTMFHD